MIKYGVEEKERDENGSRGWLAFKERGRVELDGWEVVVRLGS